MKLIGIDFNGIQRQREKRNRNRLVNTITVLLIIASAYVAWHVICYLSH
jgi:hypothetical protein